MRNALGVLALGCATWLCACAAAPQTTTAALELHALPSCELPDADRVVVRASGDFSVHAEDFLTDEPFDSERFPADARYLAFEIGTGGTRAGGLVALDGGNVRRALWMLPFGRSCPLGDPLAVAADGAALAPLADAGLLIAGGRADNGAATANALVLPAGAALAVEVEGGMLFRRVDASATPVAGGVLVVGGSDDDHGRGVEQTQMRSAHDSFEMFVDDLGRFDMSRTGKLVSGPRRDHAALLLSDGRVLIVGGVSVLGSAPLRTAELIDVASSKAHAIDAELDVGRVRPMLLTLDSGTVLVALGSIDSADPDRDTVADMQSPLVAEVERFDPKRERFDTVETLPEHPHAAVAALEGDRVAYVGCDDAETACEVVLLVPDADGFALLVPDFGDALSDPQGLRGLAQLRLLPLHDGRLLVTGRSTAQRTSRRAFIIDLNALTIDGDVELSRVPDVLLELSDGSRVEADASGISLARDDVQSVLDDPPASLIKGGATALALDARERWTLDANGLTASSDARADLPRLRFADVRIEIKLAGAAAASLLLEPERAAPTPIVLARDRLALGDCQVEHASGDPIAIERRGDRVVLHSGKREQACTAPLLGERVGIALRAAKGTRVSSLRVLRQ